MRRLWGALALCLGVTALLAGCKEFPALGVVLVPGSLYPMAAAEQDLVYDPSLLGEWRDASTVDPVTGDQSDINEPIGKWFFEQGKTPGTYLLGRVYGETDHTTRTARLVKNGDAMFLDAVPDSDSNESKGSHVGPYSLGLHIFIRLQQEKGQLRLSVLSPDWYLCQLETKQFPLRIERLGEGLQVITSPPDAIRAFYAKAVTDPTAFTDAIVEPIVLVRPKALPKRS